MKTTDWQPTLGPSMWVRSSWNSLAKSSILGGVDPCRKCVAIWELAAESPSEQGGPAAATFAGHPRISFFCNALDRHPDNRPFHYSFRNRRTMASTAIPESALSNAADARLLCFPYAGGGAAVYHRWRAAMPGWIDLVPVTLPGHDGRLREPPRTDLRQLAGELAEELAAVFDRPYALLGCSMGAWLAFEMTRELRRRADMRAIRLPELLVVAASPAPHVRSSQSPAHRLPDDEFLATVERRYGGIPAAVRASPDLLQLLLPALRADVQMVETYEYVEEPPLETPIFALGGAEDATVSPAQLGEWRRHTSGEFSMRLFPGGHFFLFPGGAVAGGRTAAEQATESIAVPPAVWAIAARLQRGVSREGTDATSAN